MASGKLVCLLDRIVTQRLECLLSVPRTLLAQRIHDLDKPCGRLFRLFHIHKLQCLFSFGKDKNYIDSNRYCSRKYYLCNDMRRLTLLLAMSLSAAVAAASTLIPQPSRRVLAQGTFTVDADTRIVYAAPLGTAGALHDSISAVADRCGGRCREWRKYRSDDRRFAVERGV